MVIRVIRAVRRTRAIELACPRHDRVVRERVVCALALVGEWHLVKIRVALEVEVHERFDFDWI